MTEYIIAEYSDKYGWCLFRLAGYDLDIAKQILVKLQKEYSNKQLKIEAVNSAECWWNDPTMCD